ncbi:RsmB/NOP family class I SAM-dependent RNA methyltransferase [Geoalkalibacter subterraneus]|uniref:rRNA cytosine-C5-methyltransferase n=1 Tax=Geoalkalibacter subterraneus TaxID=483547 RepID=A0A0B5FPA4_9BACT|nr:RsmB/NOP family class I SAM-dependent RNA methyltransferase [Geoalkalibacter subterraneus]AJF05925.1 rRNA cytosine-C5-methyltransferase [Geoalkalibacter subterraneus]
MTCHFPELPVEFLNLLNEVLPPAHKDAALASFSLEKPVVFRVNTLRTTAEQLLRELESDNIFPHPVPWLSGAYSLPVEDKRALTETKAFQRGLFYIQNLSSMLAPWVLDPQPGETVLDLAAAPGGKSTQIAALMKNEGRLSVVEAVKPRFFKLKANLDQQGVEIARTFLMDGRAVGRKCPQMFDRILLDAPCSSEARFSRLDPDSWAHWSPRKVKEMSRKQKGLVASAWASLKPGAVLLYCTCSFSPEENELILDRLLRRVGDEAKLKEITLPIENTQPGLTRWKSKTLHPDLCKAVRILPDEMMDGFFLALIRKAAS